MGSWGFIDNLHLYVFSPPYLHSSYFYWKCASYLYIPSIDLATCYCLTSSQICSGSQQKNDTIMTSFSTSASISPLYSLSVPLLPCFTQTFTVLLEWISFSFPVLFAHFFFLIATHIFFFLCLWEHKTLWIQSSLSGQLSSFAMCCLRCRSLKKYIYLFILALRNNLKWILKVFVFTCLIPVSSWNKKK